jgi:F-type H+-transporting ATPase subunit delta
MAKKANPRRYAQAVFEIALEKQEVERWQADLDKITAAIGDTSFLAALDSPRIKIADKYRFLRERLGDINPLALNLLQLLISRSHVGVLAQIATEYHYLVNEQRGISLAEVVTAVSLDDADKTKLSQKLGAIVGAQVEVKSEVDPAILGGFIARIGGKLLDGSTRSKLAALKRQLMSGGDILNS